MKLPSFSQLLSLSWIYYKTNFSKLIKLISISYLSFLVIIPLIVILGVIVAVPAIAFKSTILTVILATAAIIAGLVSYTFLTSWVMAVVFAGIAQIDGGGEIRVRELFKQTRPKVVSLWWTGLLASLIAMAGFAFFIVPGIIFSIWFSLISWIVVLEGDSGIKALAKSKAYLKGNTLKVFLYLLGLQIILGIIMYVPIGILNQFVSESVSGIYSFLIQVFIYPVGMIFSYFIYKGLKNPSIQIAPKRGMYIFGAVVGLVLPFIVAGVLAWGAANLLKNFQMWDSINQMQEMNQELPTDVDNYNNESIQYY